MFPIVEFVGSGRVGRAYVFGAGGEYGPAVCISAEEEGYAWDGVWEV